MRRKMDPNKKMPWLVNSIETDGVQVKVLLGSISKESKESPPGIEHLAKKGFESIGGSPFDITKHRRGAFGGAKKLAKRTQQLLNKSTREECLRIEVVGVDPGQKELCTQARAMSTNRISGEHFKHGKPNFKVSKKSTEYRFYSLAKLSLEDEKRKREGTSYGVALNRFDEAGCSLNACSEVPCYVKTSMETLAVRVKELLCIDRKKAKFTFFRARQREIDRMAKDLAGRDVTCRKEKKTSENDDGQQSQGPVQKEASIEKMKDQNSRKRELKRIVLFGKAEFGSGSRGPCPRKVLIRALALRASVILIDEYNTSKCCCCCCGKEAEAVRRFASVSL